MNKITKNGESERVKKIRKRIYNPNPMQLKRAEKLNKLERQKS